MNMTSKIAIVTTVANFDLFDKTNYLFDLRYDRFVIDGRDGMHGIHSLIYMMEKFKNLDYEYIIMADEDFILKSSESIENLIHEMNTKNITVAGVRDGGVINHRKYNPHCINTFFSIIHIKRIKEIWNKKEMLSHQKIKKNEFKIDSVLPYEYDELSLYEPYYCFYLWLLRKGEKIKYLTSKDLNKQSDNITNVVYHDNDTIIGYHSWYARSYGINKKHTDRIDKLFGLIDISNPKKVNFVLWKNPTFKYTQMIRKFFRKVKLKFQ